MAVTAAQLQVVVGGDTNDAEGKLKDINDKVTQSGGFFKTALASALGFATGAGAIDLVKGALGFLSDQFMDVLKAGEDAQQTMAQTSAVLKSTGDASGMTAGQIADLAEHFQNLTGIQADTIQQGENVLLTFTNIGQQTFPQATQAILDLSTSMHEDLQSAAIQVGKALNDPVKGMTALQRVGVTFTDAQKKAVAQMMATGNVAGAQKIILGELAREFGGSAQAAGSTFAGQLNILNARLETAKEKLGMALLPALNAVANAVMPLVSDLIGGLGDGLTDVTNKIQSVVVPAITSLAPLAKQLADHVDALAHAFLGGLGPALSGLQGSATIAQLRSFAESLRNELLPSVQSLSVWFKGQLLPALQAVGPQFESLGSALVTTLGPALLHIGEAVMRMDAQIAVALIPVLEKLLPIIIRVAGFLAQNLGAALRVIVPALGAAVVAVATFVGGLVQRLIPAITNVVNTIMPAIKVIVAIWDAAWPGMQEVLMGAWNMIAGIVKIAWALVTGIINVGLDLLAGNWKGAWNDILSTFKGVKDGINQVTQGMMQEVIGIVKTLVGAVVGLFTGLWDQLTGHSIIPDMINDIVTFFTGMPGKVLAQVEQLANQMIDKFHNLASQAVSFGSNIVQGLVNGIKGMIGNATGALAGLGSQMLNAFKSQFGIGSPSKVFHELGKNLTQGLINGLRAVDVVGPATQHWGALTGAGTGLRIGGGSVLTGGANGPTLAGIAGGATGQSVGASSNATSASIQSANIVIDGRAFAKLILPYIVGAIRTTAGVRGI